MSIAMAMRRSLLALTAVVMMDTTAMAQQQKPNILVIMADDIGDWNISAYNRGMMGYHTPNIDRIAKTLEGFHASPPDAPGAAVSAAMRSLLSLRSSGAAACHALMALVDA
jgi:hypothetical protein